MAEWQVEPTANPSVPPSGRALLTWAGKQPPAPAPVVEARLVEIVDPRQELPLAQAAAQPALAPEPDTFFGQALPNLLYYGDNRSVLTHLLAHGWRGKVKLIYIDPPFDSGGDYARKVRLRNRQNHLVGESVQYRDSWSGDAYLQFIYERLFLLRELLAENGSLWLHCDYRQVHRLRLLLEEVFGEENYLNTIAWRSQVTRGAKVNAFYFPYSTQFIEIFAKRRDAPTIWNPQRKRLAFTRAQAAAEFMEDEQGFFRTSDPGTYSFERLKELHAAGRLYAPYGGEIVVDEAARRIYPSNGGNLGVKYYLTRLGDDRFIVERGIDNLWDDIPGLGTTPGEDVGYPTQKTEALLRRVIAASTHPGDLVLDCFLGSGTTAAVAQKMGRRWIGCDLSYGAIQTARRRLQRILQETGPGFALYRMADVSAPAPATATLRVEARRDPRDRGWVEVTVLDYQAQPPQSDDPAHRRVRPHIAEDWRSLVDAVEIDPAYDGMILRATVADAPAKRRESVAGHYRVAAPEPATLAVRITDIFGNEHLITKDL
jgi:DNA modification methylase